MPAMNITVLGDGAMATVCANLLVDKDQHVTLWVQTGRNDRYLGGFALPQALRLVADEAAAVRDAELVVFAIPTQFIRRVGQRFAGHLPDDVPIVTVAKGIENQTLMRPTQIIADALGRGSDSAPIAALSGPSIARELARCLPATVAVACEDQAFAEQLQRLFTTHWLRVYTNADPLGVELAGALKNVIAIAAGIIDGLQAGYNAKSALLARGLAEITRLGNAMGASPDTFFGITGVGDLATTCFCPEGRNRTCGEHLGKGLSLEQAEAKIHGIVEGVATCRSVLQLAEQHDIEMPITHAVHDVLFAGLDPIDAITRLMSRPLKEETVG